LPRNAKQGYTSPMSELPSIIGTPREWAKDLTTATAIGVFLGVIGPFGSFNGGPVELRIFFWVVNFWVGFIIIATAVRLAIRAAIRLDVPVWFAISVGVAIGAFPLGLIVSLFSAHFWPGNHGHMSRFYEWYGQTLAISEPCSWAFYLFRSRLERQAAELAGPAPAAVAPTPPAAPPAPSPTADFLDRLPPRLGRELLCLQMEDHYVRAHTARGSDLILIPLKQAAAELGAIEGMQVHRSWWVARAAVRAAVTNGRNTALELTNGVVVPVSRASVAPLKAAGWLT